MVPATNALPVVTVPENEKPPVTALREIATGNLDIDHLRQEFVQSYKKIPVVDDSQDGLESSAALPELKEIDEELSGEAAIKEELAGEPATESADETEPAQDPAAE